MKKGQKVVCVDDTFMPWARLIYKHLPKKGSVYQIREVYLGRKKMIGGDGEVGLLLEGMNNPPDPTHKDKQEPGFSSERFVPLEELPPEEVEESLEIGELVPA